MFSLNNYAHDHRFAIQNCMFKSGQHIKYVPLVVPLLCILGSLSHLFRGIIPDNMWLFTLAFLRCQDIFYNPWIMDVWFCLCSSSIIKESNIYYYRSGTLPRPDSHWARSLSIKRNHWYNNWFQYISRLEYLPKAGKFFIYYRRSLSAPWTNSLVIDPKRLSSKPVDLLNQIQFLLLLRIWDFAQN